MSALERMENSNIKANVHVHVCYYQTTLGISTTVCPISRTSWVMVGFIPVGIIVYSKEKFPTLKLRACSDKSNFNI